MANKNLFETVKGLFTPKTDTVNEAGGTAYKLSPKQALAQYAATGCFNHTFYTDAGEQLEKVLALANEVEAEFVARTAIYAREKGFMKDVPALLVAVLSLKDKQLFERTFPRVIDNGRMLRNFVQIMRSGAVGRKSLGSLPKRMVREWFETRKAEQIFKQSVGQTPSFADVLKMVHPKPKDAQRAALYGYFIGRDIDADKLPEIVKQFERFKAGDSMEVPDGIPFQMLTALPLRAKEWTAIARNAQWQMTRMNLNTFQRHGVFRDAEWSRLSPTACATVKRFAKREFSPINCFRLLRRLRAIRKFHEKLPKRCRTRWKLPSKTCRKSTGKCMFSRTFPAR